MSFIGPLVTEISHINVSAQVLPNLIGSDCHRQDPFVDQAEAGAVESGNLNDETDNIAFLRHQWSDHAHTLQFASTDEYFETVEHEPDRPSELRDILRNTLYFPLSSH